ncbi:MAG TPA: prepilin-type N-terminal cleavage/methylation domain-containing protein [Candidatus Saccharimonadales bacterium]|nr:prepilin-type N-terminal cleavage/methylation domain-containing protein [Candidatus Saccharimonadales bacterium]
MNGQKGFTIIEVLLFVAVSALLLAGVMAGITTNLNSTRFLASTKSLENYLQKQYDDVLAGVAERHTDASCPYSGGGGATQPPGASDGCVVIGKLVRFTDKQLLVFPVVSQMEPTTLCHADGNGDALAIGRYCPITLSSNRGVDVAEYEYQWGVSVAEGNKLQPNGNPADYNALAILRSPASGNMYTFSFYIPGNTLTQPTQTRSLYSGDLDKENLNRPAALCLQSDTAVTRTSYIYLTGGLGADAVRSGDNPSGLPEGLTC